MKKNKKQKKNQPQNKTIGRAVNPKTKQQKNTQLTN